MSSMTHSIDQAIHPDHRQYGTAANSGPHGTYGVTGAEAPGPAYPAGSAPAQHQPLQHQPLQHQPQVAGAGAGAGTGVPGSVPATAGVNPHHSNAMNTVDPRVASGTTAPTGGYNGTTGAAGHGGTIPSGHHYQHPGTESTATGPAPHTAGPHHSDMTNRLDPTVDNNLSKTGHTGPSHVPAAGHAPASTGPAPHTAGPHHSDMMNRLDPSVDNDLSRTKHTGPSHAPTAGHVPVSSGYNTTGPASTHVPAHGAIPATTRHGTEVGVGTTHGPTQGPGTTTGTGSHRHHSGTGGPHRSGIANALDPHVDSTLPGPAPHTGGPHRHDILNRLDPTVDSKTGLRK